MDGDQTQARWPTAPHNGAADGGTSFPFVWPPARLSAAGGQDHSFHGLCPCPARPSSEHTVDHPAPWTSKPFLGEPLLLEAISKRHVMATTIFVLDHLVSPGYRPTGPPGKWGDPCWKVRAYKDQAADCEKCRGETRRAGKRTEHPVPTCHPLSEVSGFCLSEGERGEK